MAELKWHDNQYVTETILRRRYLTKDCNGQVIETPAQLFERVAKHVASAEARYGATKEQVAALTQKFFTLMSTGTFLPNSPTLMNAGRQKGMLSACFVLPVKDSIGGIFTAVKHTALIQQAGGGTGFSFDRLRPTGDIVQSSGGKTSGPLSFMKVISQGTHAIQQGAFRRGANMGMMSANHPDIIRFLYAKQDPTVLNNFNLSVKVPDDFMRRLQAEPNSPHVVVNPRTKKRYSIPRSIDKASYSIDDLVCEGQSPQNCFTVGDTWEMIVRNAWATGEPGICFADAVNRANPTPRVGEIEATNPCGEQPLLPYEACNLGSIDISKFVNAKITDLKWSRLAAVVKLAARFLDNVIDINHYPIAQIKRMTLANRKIGLGIMGFADTLVLLGIRYDSKQAVAFAERLAAFVQNHAHRASEQLARQRGCFANWKGSIWEQRGRKMRNAAVTTIAPTGTISLLAGCSSGIEPIYSLAYERNALDGKKFMQLHLLLERLGTKQGWLSDEVRQLLARGVAPADIPQIPSDLSITLVTAHEITPEAHVNIQAAFQKYTDNAVSKTVNLPSTATVQDVDKVFRLAFEKGCKGITVYVDGCRENQVLTRASDKRPETDASKALRPRIRRTAGSTTKYRMGCGTLFVTVNRDDSGLCEVFSNLGKAGGCPAQSEATCRAVSVALRCGVSPEILIEQLKGIRCLSAISRKKNHHDIDVLSCPDAIARALQDAVGSPQARPDEPPFDKCPVCGHPLRMDSGCKICDHCGYDKCG